MDGDGLAPATAASTARVPSEDLLVAELARLGVRYLSRGQGSAEAPPRPAPELLADLARQPSSRVRLALIALLVSRPDYASASHAALRALSPPEARLFKLLYTAAVFLQREYAAALQQHLAEAWRWLPDLFSAELGVPQVLPGEALRALARIHAQTTGSNLNWYGTYHHTLQQLLHRWELESRWSRSRPKP